MNKIKILQGNCIDKIKELEDNSIDCVVSSPPYFGLRDYGTGKWEGGKEDCPHKRLTKISKNTSTGHAGMFKQGHVVGDAIMKDKCNYCGAIRIDKQFGLEKTYQDYLANTVKLFETFKPKLKDTATIWWNVGDSYSSGKRTSTTNQSLRGDKNYGVTRTPVQNGIKEKDLLMIPNRVAIALQDEGWYIRSEIIWHKPNPMPESVRDRPTSCHEKIWLITKSKKYYYDSDAIREPLAASSLNRLNQDIKNQKGSTRGNGGMKSNGNMKAVGNKETRNKRNVWTITTKPFKDAHFATFPKDLIEPCIKAGCPEGGVVLDPFGGSGTTGIVSALNNRNAILIELNSEYIKIAEDRIDKEVGLFNK
jgi:DNA modification methylase